jgi:WD40 repeat protein
VKFWVLRKDAPLQMAGYPMKVRELAWSPDGRYLATGGGEQVTVWDCSGKGPEGSEPIVLEGHESPVSVLAYQAGGPVLASGGRDGRVILWQPGAVKRALDQDRISGGVSQVAWAPGDGRLAVGGESGLVAVYSV